MSKHSEFISVSEFCKREKIKPLQFYKILSRHPELLKKLKISANGERVFDEKSISAAGAILRKEKNPDFKKCTAAAADEINILVAQIEELRKEVTRLKCKNKKMRIALAGKNANHSNNKK